MHKRKLPHPQSYLSRIKKRKKKVFLLSSSARAQKSYPRSAMRLPKVMADFDAFWASHSGEGDKAPTMSAWVDQDREDAEGRSNVGRATCGPGVVLGVLTWDERTLRRKGVA
ncbi:hypothetical protein ERO13_A06G054200v2 [Gossypium hirsutum]|nr:hypothetical protein ERO13_A06G054200v2 [Gossypium hirsutum]